MSAEASVVDTITAITDATDCEPAITIDVEGVAVEVADAAACARLGCRRGDDLLRATVDGVGTRVVCPPHLQELLEREGLL
mgnify:CR=1 FL=1